MALMLGKLHDALIDGGTSPDKAREAAEEAAGYETRLTTMSSDIATLKTDVAALKLDVATLKLDVAVIRRDLGLGRWMLIALILGVFLPLVKDLLLGGAP